MLQIVSSALAIVAALAAICFAFMGIVEFVRANDLRALKYYVLSLCCLLACVVLYQFI